MNAAEREEETPFTNTLLHADMHKKGVLVILLTLVSGMMINLAVLIAETPFHQPGDSQRLPFL